MEIRTTAGTYSIRSDKDTPVEESPADPLRVVCSTTQARDVLVDGLTLLKQAQDGDFIVSDSDNLVIVSRAALGEWVAHEISEYITYSSGDEFQRNAVELRGLGFQEF